MPVKAAAAITQLTGSNAAGRECAIDVQEQVGAPAVVLAYVTVNHDAKAFLSAASEVLGPDVPVLGCSTQGIMGRRFFAEDGYIAGLLALGGDLTASVAVVEDIPHDTAGKGRQLAQALQTGSAGHPSVVIMHYDPLCGVDMDPFLEGMNAVLDCPVVGGGASHPWGPLQTTYQFFEGRVMSAAAVGVALSGDVRVETAISFGCSPVGIEMEVTESDGNRIIALDGRSAVDVWTELAGSATFTGGDQTAALAVGVPTRGDGRDGYLVRAAFGFGEDGSAILQSGIPKGTTVMLHHRTFEDALEGSEAMARDLASRLGDTTVRAVLGLECGGRTKPFLGIQTCRAENDTLQEILAPDAAWLGLLPWGEIHPAAGVPVFNNFTYPMVVIADR